MPALKNPRWESFCWHRANGTVASRAYVAAGFKANDGNAARLNGNEKIRGRIREIVEELTGTMAVSIESIAMQLDRDREFAYECGNPSAAQAASMAKAKLFGLDVNRSLNVNLSGTFNGMTEDELGFELALMINEVRAAAGKPVLQNVPDKIVLPEKKH